MLLHSDRGAQYTPQEFQVFLQAHGIVSNMSGVGNCYDNAVAESFFGLLKRERVHRPRGPTRAVARADIFDSSSDFIIANGATPLRRGWPQEILWSNMLNSLL